jgi:hypothetical protein
MGMLSGRNGKGRSGKGRNGKTPQRSLGFVKVILGINSIRSAEVYWGDFLLKKTSPVRNMNEE